MKLTTHQEAVLTEALDTLDNSSFLVITGKAGTGKTTLVRFLIQELKKLPAYRFSKIICSAPTNKAVKVLREKVEAYIPKIEFKTVHSALRLKRDIHPKTGKISFKPDYSTNRDPLENCSLLVVDEASMVNSEILKEIFSCQITRPALKIVFIGDESQLPPVGEKYSKVFHSDFPLLELTEIIRQGEGNPIIDLSRDFSLLKSRRDQRNSVGGFVFSNNLNHVIDTLAHVNGTDELKYLSWTNRDVDYINKAVRERIYQNPNKIEVGESLIFNAPYKDMYFTNDEITVETLTTETKVFTAYNIPNPNYNMTSLDEPEFLVSEKELKYYVINGKVPVIHEDSEETFKEMVKSFRSLCLKQMAKWVDFYTFTENFASVKYNHAITIHKSQGSTFKQVIINIRNCMLNKDSEEREKLLYTAITRASELVVLYNI